MVPSSALRRRGRRLATVLLAVGSLVLGATPAEAAPEWPSAGYTPSCDTVLREASAWHYYDTTPPTIQSFTAPRFVALTSVPRTFNAMTARVTDACSGVDYLYVYYTLDGLLEPGRMMPKVDHWFDATLSLRMTTSLKVQAPGPIAWQALEGLDRFDDFSLSLDHKTLLSSVPRTADVSAFATEELPPTDVTYLVRKTFASAPTRSRSSVRSGAKVTLTSRFTVATTGADMDLQRVTVKLQRRRPGGTWVILNSSKTSIAGMASFHINPTGTASYRFVYTGLFASPWNAPVTSSPVSVKVL
jgi:hypothetical protein